MRQNDEQDETKPKSRQARNQNWNAERENTFVFTDEYLKKLTLVGL